MDVVTNEVISKFFKQESILTDHQITSYNDLIDSILPDILNNTFPLTIKPQSESIQEIKISIEKTHIKEPTYTENNGCTKLMTPSGKIKKLHLFTIGKLRFISRDFY